MSRCFRSILVVVLSVILFAGCYQKLSVTDPVDSRNALATNSVQTDYVNAVTSATPIPIKHTATSGHPGWDRADCATCHENIHNSGYRATQCTNCHGINTERKRPDGIQTPGVHNAMTIRHLPALTRDKWFTMSQVIVPIVTRTNRPVGSAPQQRTTMLLSSAPEVAA